MLKIFMIILFYCTTLFANKQILQTNNNTNYYDNFEVLYLKDSNNSFSINEIQKYNFTKTTPNKFSLGYTKGTLWFKFDIKNQTNDKDFLLSLNEVFYETANLYYQDENTKIIKKNNSLFTLIKQREIKVNHLGFKLPLQPNKTQTIYLELKGKYAYFGNITISKEDYFQFKNFFNINSWYIFVFGVIFIIIIFNLFLFLKLKEKIYGYYVGYTIFNLIYYINISGVLVFFDSQEYIYKLQLSAAFMLAFLVLFTNEILSIRDYLPRFSKVLKAISLLFFFFGFMVVYSYQPWNKIINNSAALIVLILIITSIFIYFKGNNKSKYYIFAIVLYFVFVMFFALMVAGVVEYSYISRYGFVTASAIEAVIFSLMLSDRYNELKEKMIETQTNLLQAKEENELFLEDKVKQRTHELQVGYNKIEELLYERELLIKEVHHRVKNNFHMLLGILWIEEQKDGSSQSRFQKLRTRIKSMSMIHERLYKKQNISDISMKEYLNDILNNLLNITSSNKIIVTKNIEPFSLDFEQALALGIIVNEIISNSIKHNKDLNPLLINISFSYFDSKYLLVIKDNGTGFDTSTQSDGIGIDLIKSFTANLSNSKCNFLIESGVSFTLQFSKKEKSD